jgi:hypothetical protein
VPLKSTARLVDDEDRQAELLRGDGGDPEADDDRHQGHEHRHEPGDHGPEHEHQDDDGDRQPEVDLAVAQVAGGQCGEVVADRVIPGDRDGEPACAVGGSHGAHDGFDVCIARRVQPDQGSVSPGRDERAAGGEIGPDTADARIGA